MVSPPNACKIRGQKSLARSQLIVGRYREKVKGSEDSTLVVVVWLRVDFASHLRLVDFVGRKPG
jgi:hypothetical protein